jgi:amino acid transporter
MPSQQKVARAALLVSLSAFALGVLAMVPLTISAVLGAFPWGTWAFAMVLIFLFGVVVNRARRRVKAADSRASTESD